MWWVGAVVGCEDAPVAWSRAGVMSLAELRRERRELLHASHVVLQRGGCLAPLKRLLLASFALHAN